MSGKGAKGLLTGKTPASKDKDKDKKKPITRSSRAGLQVFLLSLPHFHFSPFNSTDRFTFSAKFRLNCVFNFVFAIQFYLTLQFLCSICVELRFCELSTDVGRQFENKVNDLGFFVAFVILYCSWGAPLLFSCLD